VCTVPRRKLSPHPFLAEPLPSRLAICTFCFAVLLLAIGNQYKPLPSVRAQSRGSTRCSSPSLKRLSPTRVLLRLVSPQGCVVARCLNSPRHQAKGFLPPIFSLQDSMRCPTADASKKIFFIFFGLTAFELSSTFRAKFGHFLQRWFRVKNFK